MKPLAAKNSCSPELNVKGALQSTQLRVSSVYIGWVYILKKGERKGEINSSFLAEDYATGPCDHV